MRLLRYITIVHGIPLNLVIGLFIILEKLIKSRKPTNTAFQTLSLCRNEKLSNEVSWIGTKNLAWDYWFG